MTWLLLAQVTHPIVSKYIEFLTHTHLPFLTFPRLFFSRLCGSKGLLYIYFSLKRIYRSGWLFKIYVVSKVREQSSWNQYILTFSFFPLCTKYWSRLGVSVSLHLSKAWGHLIRNKPRLLGLFLLSGFLFSISRIQDTEQLFPIKQS